MSEPVQIHEGDAAQLIFGQSTKLGAIADDVLAGLTNDGTRRLLVYSTATGKVAVIPWFEVAAIAVRAGLERAPKQQAAA
ncbi:MAG: hypothetical protein LW860_16395 [Xanthomonadaceae bacterium]|jgi:hypothetical protein|nr:hypothetical protein [Xanthomonadaceae bacterium]